MRDRHRKQWSKNLGFGTKFRPILELKSDPNRSKNRSENWYKICMHLDTDFWSILVDFGGQDGGPRRANEGPTNQPFLSNSVLGPPGRPKTVQDPPRSPPRRQVSAKGERARPLKYSENWCLWRKMIEILRKGWTSMFHVCCYLHHFGYFFIESVKIEIRQKRPKVL